MLDATFNRLRERYYSLTDTPASLTRWRIDLPDDPQILAALRELIAQLASEEVWLERDGSLTQLESATIAMRMYNSFRKDDTMLGMIMPFATDATPETMLLCDGGIYDAADYPELFAIINPALILSGSTFQTPDLRGRFVMAEGNTDYPEYSEGGEYLHTLLDSELAFHQHTTPPHIHGITGYLNIPLPAGLDPVTVSSMVEIPSSTAPSDFLTDSGAGGGEPHENTPPYYVLRYGMIAKVGTHD